MSTPLSSEHLEDIRGSARRMVERARAHEGDLHDLVKTAEGVARQASVLAVALARSDVNEDELSRVCSAHVRRSADNAEATLRACVSAREQHVTAYRLCTRLDTESAARGLAASRASAVLVVD